MLTEIDERKGLVKTYWANIRDRVGKVEPTFAKIVDDLNPDKSFPIFLAYFSYGTLKGDTVSPFIPKVDGGVYRLKDFNAPKDVIKHLGYGMYDSPFGMVLEKNFEIFFDLKDEKITIPKNIYTPGSFFSFIRNLNERNNHMYATNSIFSTSSGVRSTFMLPNVGCAKNHVNLQREFGIQIPPPKSLYDHWYVFNEILNNDIFDEAWTSCLIYLSEKWIHKLKIDKTWADLRAYLYQKAWAFFQYDLTRPYYDIYFSLYKTSEI